MRSRGMSFHAPGWAHKLRALMIVEEHQLQKALQEKLQSENPFRALLLSASVLPSLSLIRKLPMT